MKKVLSLFFALLVVTGLLTACGQSNTPETTVATEGNKLTDVIVGPTIESLEEYNKFLETIPEGRKFVTYDDVKEIGTFKGFVGITDTPNDGYIYYVYGLVDETGKEFVLNIEHTEEEVDTVLEAIERVDNQDMRFVNKNQSGDYTHQGLIYEYWEGRLSDVVWRVDGIRFKLDGVGFALADYPITEDTFVSKLLSQETAVAAVESINAKVAMK